MSEDGSTERCRLSAKFKADEFAVGRLGRAKLLLSRTDRAQVVCRIVFRYVAEEHTIAEYGYFSACHRQYTELAILPLSNLLYSRHPPHPSQTQP